MVKKLQQKFKFLSFFEPEEKPLRHRRWLCVATVLGLVLACCCLGFLSLFFSMNGYKGLVLHWLSQPKLLALNFLPFVLLGLVLWLATNRAWLAFLIDGILCLIYSWANYWKLMGRTDAVWAEDLTLLKEALEIGGEGYIVFTWPVIVSAVLVLLGTAVLCLCCRGRVRPAIRLPFVPVLLLLGVLAYNGWYTSGALYNSFPVWSKLNPWMAVNQYISRGGIYPFLHSIQSAVPTPPEGYDADAAKAVLQAYPTDDIPQERQVSVIMVMLEAYADLSDHTDRITGADPYADYHALQAESYTGELMTNIFSGGTVDTERCVLTGFSDLTSFRRKSWSYARYFSEQGYATVGGHAGYEAFYNRVNVNRNLGLDDYRFIENYYHTFVSGIPTDRELLPDITAQAKALMAEGQPVFSYNVTYQNHGPYPDDVLNSETVYVPRGDLSESDYNIVNNYLDGIADTGRRMTEMVDSFRDSEEPVILVFFGDHKSWLGDNSCTYAALGIDFTDTGYESAVRMYQTDYLIWANDAAKEQLGNDFVGSGPMISPCYLMNVLFDLCGWEGPSYMKLSREVMDLSPVVSSLGWYGDAQGLMPMDALPAETQEKIKDFRRVQFYLSRDSGGSLPEA